MKRRDRTKPNPGPHEIIRGAPPSHLKRKRKAMPISGPDSPWWRWVAREISERDGWLGTIRTIEDIVASLPRYPDGRQVLRGKAAARRLAPALQLVSRGPGGSLGIGATYRIVRPPDEVKSDLVDDEYLMQQANRMIGRKHRKRKLWKPPSTG